MKKLTVTAAAVMCAVIMTGCSHVRDKIDSFIENDANIGKNAPAVGTIGDIDALNEAAAETGTSVLSEEEKAASEAADKRAETEKKADDILSGMSDKEKIGQLILARCPKNAAEVMEEYQLGGFTLYADDFKNRDISQVKAFTREVSAAAAVPPFFAADEEGGSVVRISGFSQYRDEPFSSPQLLYNRGGTELLEIDGKEKAKLFKRLGLNFNLAPVADITENEDSYIYSRTLGQGPENTAKGITAIVSISDSMNVASCLKHFPGYGENTDTHKGAAHDSRELYEFYNRDFVPFEAGINATEDKTPAVMVGHTVYDLIDPDVPASLSLPIHQALRDRLNFDGVAVTDDLGMDAIKAYSGEQSPYVLALLADNDLLCVSDYEKAVSDITAALESGELNDAIIDTHVRRILIMKIQYSIID